MTLFTTHARGPIGPFHDGVATCTMSFVAAIILIAALLAAVLGSTFAAARLGR